MTTSEKGSSGRNSLCLAMTVALLAAVADQASKWVILEHVMNPPRLIEVTSFFNLTLGFNRGVTFGMLSSDEALGRWMLIGLALVIVAGLIIWAWRAGSRIEAASIGGIIGGAIGNVIDRVRQGAVRTSWIFMRSTGTGPPSTWPIRPSSAASRPCYCIRGLAIEPPKVRSTRSR
jgi:signal peptidase II